VTLWHIVLFSHLGFICLGVVWRIVAVSGAWNIAAMGEEGESSKSKNVGGGAGAGAGGSRKGAGRPCKKPKPKKVPQRGLGVAQLEKIRLEEEEKEKKAAAAAAAVAVAGANANGSSKNSPCDLRLQFANFPRCNHPSSPNSLPSSTVSLANSGGGGGSEACWHGGVPPQGRVSGPHLWAHHNFELGHKNLGMDPKLTLASSLPCQSNPLGHPFNWVQRTQQQHHSSSMVRGFNVWSLSWIFKMVYMFNTFCSCGIITQIWFGFCRWVPPQELHQQLCLNP